MKVVIIEDELLVAEDLVRTLNRINPQIEVVQVLNSVKQGISYFSNNPKPDLIFSDIRLGDGLSFTIFREVSVVAPVIFCTAFDEYAIQAFKANGIEYILKPFNKGTISSALDKFSSLQKYISGTVALHYEAAVKALSEYGAAPAETILIKYRDKLLPVRLTDVAFFYVENYTSYAYLFNQKVYVIPQSLEDLEKNCGQKFFRTNRQYLVSRRAIQDASTFSPRKLKVQLTFPYEGEILVSKLRTAKFKDWLIKADI